MRYFLLVLSLLILAVFPFTASAQDTTPIAVGDSVEGELTAEAPEAVYSVQIEEGALVQITLVSDEFDPYLVLATADGEEVDTDDDSAGSLDSRIDYMSEAGGEYLITVTSFAAHNGQRGATGAYTLSVRVVEVETIEYGETFEGAFIEDAYAQDFRFTAAAGDSVIIRLESNDFDSYLRLRDPQGDEIAYNDDGAGNLNSLIGPLSLTEGGVYTIVASSLNGSSVGDFVLSLQSANLEPITLNEEVTGELSSSNPVAYYSLEGESGDVISVSVDSDIDTNLAINDPSNYQVAFDEDGGSGDNPEITDFVLPSDGVFSIVVGSPFSEAGSFVIVVSRAELPSLNDGPVTLNFNSSVVTRVLRYTAEAGDVLRITASSVSGDEVSPSIDITQDGMSLSYASANYVSEFSLVFTAETEGDLTLTISDYSYTENQIEVRVSSAE